MAGGCSGQKICQFHSEGRLRLRSLRMNLNLKSTSNTTTILNSLTSPYPTKKRNLTG